MSWQQYGDALRFNFDEAQRVASTPPIACPNDGEALEALPDGRRHCPAGDFTWPASGRAAE